MFLVCHTRLAHIFPTAMHVSSKTGHDVSMRQNDRTAQMNL